MHPRRKVTVAVLLLAGGFAAGWLFRPELTDVWRAVVPPSEGWWQETVRRDAATLVALVRPDPRLPAELPPDLRARWDENRLRYPPERLADLRRRLEGYLALLEAEYADAAEIYRSGQREFATSDAAREARRRVEADFGPAAAALLAELDQLRDKAYLASPKTAGYDPDEQDYVALERDLREWLPRARARIAELTAIP
jgi:hypothetical protein